MRYFVSFIFGLVFMLAISNMAIANCKDHALRQKVAETAKEEKVNENELLSIIAHESGCRYFAIAWNLPGKPETAKSKFFDHLSEAKLFAQSLISTGRYRVDVGIGQINHEANIRPKGWSLDEVLNPDIALKRVAKILKERGWKNYHSSNPVLAKRWQQKALMTLSSINGSSSNTTFSASSPLVVFINNPIKKSPPLVIF
ncbi:MAG TPA: hypothetical protein DDW49_09180 [Deltaproteobacteria bacterium]|nr:MAG: hypothetical protein A2048_08740 [Deltaproteobacteria bacterium GWA2_45_12]HBF13533.1 hypothetical protein [Deltaproteobacteria bacterium]